MGDLQRMEQEVVLVDALIGQIKRVTAIKESWLVSSQDCPELALGMGLATKLLQTKIEYGVDAAASGNTAEMMAAYHVLAECSDAP